MTQSPYPGDSLQRLQAVELEILAVVDKLCRDNSIDYFIDGGTCLGAVRHGGFIPWDDDADIGIPHKDYERFCKIALTDLPEGYSLHTSLNTPGYSALWAKVFRDGTKFIDDNCFEAGYKQGIFVDILPFCQLDANPKVAQKQCQTARMAQLKSYLKHFSRPKLPKGTPAKSLVLLACKIIHNTIARTWSQTKLQQTMDHAFNTSNSSNKWISAVYTNYGAFDADVIFPTQDIAFDGLTLRAPHNTDVYLRTEYGDYMQLPPEDMRYTHAPLILDFGDGKNVMDTN